MSSVIGFLSGSTPSKGFLKVLQIGDWNMDTTQSVAVAHGISIGTAVGKILGGWAILRNDANDGFYVIGPNFKMGADQPDACISLIDATNVNLFRNTGLFFDSTDFDATSYNRGHIVLLVG